MANPWEHYIYAMSMMCHLTGEKDCLHCKDQWLPMIYHVVTNFTIFNSGAIISQSLSKNVIERAKNKLGELHSTFYMFSYLMDCVSAFNAFLGMGWKWTSSYSHVHVMCQDL